MVAALISTSSHYQVLWQIRIWLASYHLLCCSSSQNDATFVVLIDSVLFFLVDFKFISYQDLRQMRIWLASYHLLHCSFLENNAAIVVLMHSVCCCCGFQVH